MSPFKVLFPNSQKISEHLKNDSKFTYAEMFKEDNRFTRHEIAEKIGEVLGGKRKIFPMEVFCAVGDTMTEAGVLTWGLAADMMLIDETTVSLGRLVGIDISGTNMRAAP